MNTISSISAVSGTSASSSSNQQTIEELQQQMMLYTQFAQGTGPAAEAYKALQTALQSKNVSQAQTAMAQLKRDSESASSPSPATTNPNPAANFLTAGIKNGLNVTA